MSNTEPAAVKPIAEMSVEECKAWALSAADRDEAHRRREAYFMHHLNGANSHDKVLKKIAELQKQQRAAYAAIAPARALRTRLSFADMEIGEAIDSAFKATKAA